MNRAKEIDRLRKIMGTAPVSNPRERTFFYEGVSGITVRMIGFSNNPYKEIFTMAASTWGKKIDKWAATSPIGRFLVVLAALQRQTLPVPLEAPQFTFAIENPSRSAFDQIARSRIGVGFGSVGMRDNNWLDSSFRIPSAIAKNDKLKAKFIETVYKIKDTYKLIVQQGKQSWQAGRSILPMSLCWRFSMTINYSSLQSMCSQRLQFCEQEDTVATLWLVRNEVEKKFPLLANYLRPGCDWSKSCNYHKAYSLSECFGCLFKGCGRWPEPKDYSYCTFNESCTDKSELERQLHIKIKSSEEWIDYTENDYDKLDSKDKKLFEDNSD